MWSVALGLLLALGALCWAVGVPLLHTRSVVADAALGYVYDSGVFRKGVAERAVQELGGGQRAARRLARYVRLRGAICPYWEEALGLLRRCGERATPELIALARGAEGDELYQILSQLDSPLSTESDLAATEELLPLALEHMNHQDEVMRRNAVWMLTMIGPRARFVPVLRDALEDRDCLVRGNSARLLGMIGEAARPAIPDLEKAAEDQDWYVRQAAAGAIEKIAPSASGGVDETGSAEEKGQP
jgi:HEAT repeat protein